MSNENPGVHSLHDSCLPGTGNFSFENSNMIFFASFASFDFSNLYETVELHGGRREAP